MTTPSLDFADARNSQYVPILFVVAGGGGSPDLDFSQSSNSQYDQVAQGDGD